MELTLSRVYALAMAKHVYVQVRGTEKPLVVRADTVTKQDIAHRPMLILELNGKPVGEFEAASVAGWWIEDDESSGGAYGAASD